MKYYNILDEKYYTRTYKNNKVKVKNLYKNADWKLQNTIMIKIELQREKKKMCLVNLRRIQKEMIWKK